MAGREESNNLAPIVDRLVENRYGSAIDDVRSMREQHPDVSQDELANRLIRRYAKDLAIGGAVTGGAAAAPVAGMAVAAASAGADAAFSVGRLGEMIMAIGLIYGHDTTSVDDRRVAVLTVMGLADGAAVGMSGLAARAGARGGARILRRLPTGPVAPGAGASRKAIGRLTHTRGPWSLAALIPYGIGAGVGATGNVLLARAVGRAAKEYFGATAANAAPPTHATIVVEVDDEEVEVLVEIDEATDDTDGHALLEDDIEDAEIVE